MSEIGLKSIVRIDRVWLDERHTFTRKPAAGGRYWRIVVDGTCNGCQRHTLPARHLEYLKVAFPSVTEARRYANALLADVQRGIIVPAVETVARPVTVGEWLKRWITDADYIGDISPVTLQSYTQIVNDHLIPAFGALQLEELSAREHINSFYRAQTEKKLSSSTVNKHHVVLSMALSAAVQEGHLTRNPADPRANKIVLPPRKGRDSRKREHHALTDEQIGMLLNRVAGSDLLEVPVALAVLGGLRAQEILGLEWRDVDVKGRLLHVRQALQQTRGEDGHPVLKLKDPKSEHGKRAIPLSDELAAILTRWRAERAAIDLMLTDPGALVFPEDRTVIRDPKQASTRLLARSALSGRWLAFAQRDENADILAGVTFHDLRHGAATFWLHHGIPLFRVSRWLGHADIGITANIYGHEEPDANDAELISVAMAGVKRPKGPDGADVVQLRKQQGA
jgi:integrase